MSTRQLLLGVCRFFSSDQWWRPVLSFLFANCRLFYAEFPTHEEFACFTDFVRLATDLVDAQLCPALGVAPAAFARAMLSLVARGEFHARSVVEMLKRATDFVEFRAQMLQHNVRVEAAIARALLDFMARHPEAADPDAIAAAVARAVQAEQDRELAALAERSGRQMRALLGLAERPGARLSAAAGGDGGPAPAGPPDGARAAEAREGSRESSPDARPPPGERTRRPAGKGAEVDPAEVERRRQFYVQQRDRLREQEEREGRGGRARVSPPRGEPPPLPRVLSPRRGNPGGPA